MFSCSRTSIIFSVITPDRSFSLICGTRAHGEPRRAMAGAMAWCARLYPPQALLLERVQDPALLGRHARVLPVGGSDGVEPLGLLPHLVHIVGAQHHAIRHPVHNARLARRLTIL